MADNPTLTIFVDGYTFRWARRDNVVTVFRGRHRAEQGLEGLVGRMPVSAPWRDRDDVHRKAQEWLDANIRHGRPA